MLRSSASRFVRALAAAVAVTLLATLGADAATTAVKSGTGDIPSPAVPAGLTTSDWHGIRAAYEAGRHAIRPVEDGHRARNPGQRFTMHFDGRGFRVAPDAGGWSFGLELVRYGWGELERRVDVPSCTAAEGGRLNVEWDDHLSEWYVNDLRGLEHGFTVHERPPEARDSLTIELEVRGDLSPLVAPGARDVRFVDEEGGAVLTYSGLVAFDADGRLLEARFDRHGQGLLLRVEEEGAHYPVTIDPVMQQAYLKPLNTGASDRFGYSVAIAGETMVVGAPNEDSGATCVNGYQHDNSAEDSGAAYVFVRNGTSWSQQAYLKATNTGAGDYFGYSVAISGDTIVVGALYEDSGASGVNGDGTSNAMMDSGAAYVYVRDGTTWTRQAYLKASNPSGGFPGLTDGDQFGWSVAISGETIAVGAPFEDSNATGVNGDQQDNTAPGSGAVYVLVRNGTVWNQEAYVKASNTNGGDGFGASVAISGDTILVGAPGEDSGVTGVDGDQLDNSAAGSGAGYAFVRSGMLWTQQAYLKPSNTGQSDGFGVSLALSGETAVIGAYGEDSNATGVDGDGSNNGANTSGAAYVFARDGTIWTQQAYLKASNTGSNDFFGWHVAAFGDWVAVGAWFEDSDGTGVNGDQDNDLAPDSGAVYVFTRTGMAWNQAAFVKASNAEAHDLFGVSVALSADALIVGASGEDSQATGSNGNQNNNSALSSGAAYVFHLLPEPSAFCFGDGSGTLCPCGNPGAPGRGCASSAGPGGLLTASGSASVAAMDLVLSGSGLVPNETGLYFQGEHALGGRDGLPFGDGLRCAGGEVVRLEIRVADASGDSSTSIDLAAAGGVQPGDTRFYQLYYRDPLPSPCSSGFNFTNALQVDWGQ